MSGFKPDRTGKQATVAKKDKTNKSDRSTASKWRRRLAAASAIVGTGALVVRGAIHRRGNRSS
ncbi:MAG: hypothetical protein JWN01_291 [Patescibacteria group bacterium]|nr:hypothetical protein [Patescibacteria group bacterium]